MPAVAELFADASAHHAEGPFWDDRSDRLLFVDALAGEIVAVDAAGACTRYKSPSPVVTVVRRRAQGGYAVATEHGIAVCDESFSDWNSIAQVSSDHTIRTNDGGCDPHGGFVIGTMAYAETPGSGSVYRVSADHQITTVLNGVSISNGVQWSADGTRVFYIDTPTRQVDVFNVDPDSGAWYNRRPHLRIDRRDGGVPDGMAIDEEDSLWIALWGSGAVCRFDASGQLIATVEVPGITQVSSCAFGGRNRNILFITTSREGLVPCDEPHAGAIFSLQTDTHGATLPEFAG